MVVLGGAKVTDKIALIDRFLDVADTILIGGAMCFSFFRAQGVSTGDSLVEDEGVELAAKALEKAESSDCRLMLPVDLVLGDRFDAEAERRVQDGIDVPDGWMGLDVGPETAKAYARRDRRRGHGVLERADGRVRDGAVRRRHAVVAQAVADGPGTTVVGGGDRARRWSSSAWPTG